MLKPEVGECKVISMSFLRIAIRLLDDDGGRRHGLVIRRFLLKRIAELSA